MQLKDNVKHCFISVLKGDIMAKNRSVYDEDKANTIFAQKLRILFEKHKYSHVKLAEFIKNETGESVTRQAVGQWCNGNSCPNLRTVPIIAKFFEVTTDYLLTDTDIDTNNTDLISICSYTKLSVEAVESLKNYNENYDTGPLLSEFLKRASFYDSINHIYRCLRAHRANQAVKIIGELLHSIIEKQTISEQYSDETEAIISSFKSFCGNYTQGFYMVRCFEIFPLSLYQIEENVIDYAKFQRYNASQIYDELVSGMVELSEETADVLGYIEKFISELNDSESVSAQNKQHIADSLREKVKEKWQT